MLLNEEIYKVYASVIEKYIVTGKVSFLKLEWIYYCFIWIYYVSEIRKFLQNKILKGVDKHILHFLHFT